MTLTADQQKALDVVLGDPAMVGIVKQALSAQDQSKMADDEGLKRKMAQGTVPVVDVPVFKKAGQYSATPQSAMGFSNGAQTKESGDVVAAATAVANLDVAQQALASAVDAVGALGQAETVEPESGTPPPGAFSGISILKSGAPANLVATSIILMTTFAVTCWNNSGCWQID